MSKKVERSSRKRMAHRLGKRGYTKSGTRAQMKMIQRHHPELWAKIVAERKNAAMTGNLTGPV